MSPEIECLKIFKVAFTMVGINERFDLRASKEIVEAFYSMQYSERVNLERKCLIQQLKYHLTLRMKRLNWCSVYQRIIILNYIGYLLCSFSILM